MPAPESHPPEEFAATGDDLREFMRRAPSPVTVVTVAGRGGPRGATIGSFTSVSLEPPLVSFNVIRGTNFHAAVRRAERLAIHLLGEDQAELAEHFAIGELTPVQQFDPVELRGDASPNPPIIEGVLGVIMAEPVQFIDAGDHEIVVARATGLALDDPEARPLVYHDRGYHALGERR